MTRWICLCAAALLGCRFEPAPLPPPMPEIDAGGDASDCERACANLQRLGCPEGNPGNGDSCVAQCQDIEASGIATVRPACQAAITSCDQIDRCAVE